MKESDKRKNLFRRNRRRSIGRSLREVLVLTLCAALLPALARPTFAEPGTGEASAAPTSASAPESGQATAPTALPESEESASAESPIAPESIYQLESEWIRADGERIELEELRGKVRVLAIFYSTCEYACPIIVGRMKTLQADLSSEVGEQTGFVLVSMDPTHDDPAALRAYAERMELKGDWTLLHGDEGDVRELAALLSFRYRQEEDGGYSHSNMIVVLDKEGRPVYESVGLDSDATDAVRAVTELVKGQAGKGDPK